MEKFLLSILLMVNGAQGVQDTPASVPSGWESANSWQEQDGRITFEAKSDKLIEECRKEPTGFVEFPSVLYGAHEIFLGNSRKIQFGHPDMKESNYVVSAPILECSTVIEAGGSIRWKATAYSKYFAHVSFYPRFSETKPLVELFSETFYIGGAIGLFILSIFAMSVLYSTGSRRLIFALSGAMVGIGLYELCMIGPAFEIPFSVLAMHRVGDMGLAIGIFFVILCFYDEKLIPKKLLIANALFALAALPIYFMATTGDTIQFATSLQMITTVMCFAYAAYKQFMRMWKVRSLEAFMKFAFNVLFVLVVVNDINVFTGTSDNYTFSSIGQLCSFLILLLAVNQRITATYKERDFLRANLEQEVERKTAELNKKTVQLEKTMLDLQHTQAELVHSAKLASLGTLSAGIAHEINNSINFVNGAISPLEKMIAKLEPVSARDYEMGKKLLAAVKDGVSLTVEIVKSLRQFTGLNQAKLKDVYLAEVVKSVKTILHSRLKDNYTVNVSIPAEMSLYCDVVGMNQILMNLITNAMDAMSSGGTINVSATENEKETVLTIADTGAGIPEAIKTRIFDPFFTTKDVGSGTGLGLYIINKEMNRYQGRVEVDSTVGHGTTFRLVFPKQASQGIAA